MPSLSVAVVVMVHHVTVSHAKLPDVNILLQGLSQNYLIVENIHVEFLELQYLYHCHQLHCYSHHRHLLLHLQLIILLLPCQQPAAVMCHQHRQPTEAHKKIAKGKQSNNLFIFQSLSYEIPTDFHWVW